MARAIPEPSSDTQADAIQSLQRAHMRVTAGRVAVLQLLHEDPERRHSAEGLLQMLIDRGEWISLGTIYKCIRAMTDKDLIARAWAENGTSVFWLAERGPASHACQVICQHCYRGFTVRDPGLVQALRRQGAEHGVELSEQPVFIQMTCAACQHPPLRAAMTLGAGRAAESHAFHASTGHA